MDTFDKEVLQKTENWEYNQVESKKKIAFVLRGKNNASKFMDLVMRKQVSY